MTDEQKKRFEFLCLMQQFCVLEPEEEPELKKLRRLYAEDVWCETQLDREKREAQKASTLS